MGFEQEILWQLAQNPESTTESAFMREAAWVIYNSGFRESIVRKNFDYLSLCFCDWSSAKDIVSEGEKCVPSAMYAIANRRKHEAVLKIASVLAHEGFSSFWNDAVKDILVQLQRLPYIGPVTSVHLAKNLGFDLAKPDRHLERLKVTFGYPDVATMCNVISQASGDPVKVVDLILWRFMEQRLN